MAGKRGQSEEAAERRVRALQLRILGLSYRRIAAELNVSEAQSFRDVQSELDRLAKQAQENAEQLRTLELRRLDEMQAAIAPQLFPAKGNNANLGAIDRALRIMERRARLLGLDAPEKKEMSGADGSPLLVKLLYVDEDDE
jgi:transcriptional regulator